MLLSQAKINKTDINHILRSRGVFCSSSEKTDTVPVLVKTIISPSEYNDFISNITVKKHLQNLICDHCTGDQTHP